MSTPLCALTALAQPSGPSARSRSRQPLSGGAPGAGARTWGATGLILEGGGPMAPGWSGPLTTCVDKGGVDDESVDIGVGGRCERKKRSENVESNNNRVRNGDNYATTPAMNTMANTAEAAGQ